MQSDILQRAHNQDLVVVVNQGIIPREIYTVPCLREMNRNWERRRMFQAEGITQTPES